MDSDGSWTNVLLGDVATDITVGHVGPMADEYLHCGVPFLRSLNIEPYRIERRDLKYISQEFHRRLAKSSLHGGDLVVVRTGKPGTAAVIPEDIGEANCSDLVIIRPSEKLDVRYAAYYLNSRVGHDSIDARLVGSVQKHFNIGDARTLRMPLPPLPEQQAIAAVLGALDDKIELNRHMNQTLEAIAQAVFKSWFVDFDPVRAKAEGRQPFGMDAETAALFPDSFEDAELGEIPSGWKVSILGEVLQRRSERAIPSDETAAMPYVPIDCISSKSLFLTISKPGYEAQSSLTRFYKGDIIFGAMRPYFHKVCIAPFDGTTRTTAFVLFPRVPNDFSYVTLLIHSTKTIEYATLCSTGSTIPYAAWEHSLADMPISLPSPEVRTAFERCVRSLLDAIPPKYFETGTLTAIRDALLPKLLSGEIRVTEAQKLAEAVM